jgi:replicative DNA helicase
MGMAVRPAKGKVLYLAMDRPLQIAPSWRRMVSEADRELLAERATVWRGPLPFSLVSAPRHLAGWARDEHGAAVVVVDSSAVCTSTTDPSARPYGSVSI